MQRKIRVYGQLAKFLGKRVFRAEISSAAEAVRFLLANFPQLEQHMADQHYRVCVGDYNLELGELHDPSGHQEIKIIPVLAGAGGGAGIGQILLGIALIAVALFVPAAAVGGMTLLGVIGGALVLTGTATLLLPGRTMSQTVTNTKKDPQQESYNFSGIQNTSRQGLPLPILMGEIICGSITVSAGIDVAEIKK